jgi:hypothetical protein
MVRSLGCAAILLFASNAAADPLTTATVGSVDDLVYWGNSGNSDAAETAFFAAYLGLDPDDIGYTKVDLGGEDGVWEQVDGFPNLWAFDFQPYVLNPAYFLIKVSNATFSHFIYKNVGSLQYGVIDLGGFDAKPGKTISIMSVSHIATVPEPGTLALLALGVAAVTFGRRYAVRA